MKNVTFTADDALLEAARDRARAEHTTLNDQFRRWLAEYAGVQQRMRQYEEAMGQLRGQLVVGRKLTRDDMNER